MKFLTYNDVPNWLSIALFVCAVWCKFNSMILRRVLKKNSLLFLDATDGWKELLKNKNFHIKSQVELLKIYENIIDMDTGCAAQTQSLKIIKDNFDKQGRL